MNTVITISRQFGSGGREVGKRLSDTLGYKYYDKELIARVAEKTGLHPDYIANQSEKRTMNAFPYVIGRSFVSYQASATVQMSQEIHIEQMKLIKTIAEQENAVIIGRGADYVLRKHEVFKVFIYASDMDFRINRCYEKVPEDKSKSTKEMQKMILNIDKERAGYYKQLTSDKWGEMQNYNLCIDTSKVGIKGAVEIILKSLETLEVMH